MRMRKLMIMISVVGIIFGACKKDEHVSTKKNLLGTVIGQEVITSAGGTIIADKLEAEFPSNTFTESVTISISKNSTKSFGTDQVSDQYYINNIPENYNEPITIRLSGITSTDDLTIFITEPNFIKSLNEEDVSFRQTNYIEEDGDVVVELPATASILKSGTNSSEENSFSVGLLAVAGQGSLLSSGGHFKITYPSVSDEEAEKLGDYLEEAYSLFAGTNFGLSYAERTTWPVDVTVKPLDNTVYGYMSASVWGNNYASMQFNSLKLSDPENLRLTAGHEFMHFVQNLYDPRNRFSKAKFAAPHLWVDEAVAVWAEEFFTGKTGFVSSIRAGHELAPLKGLLKGAEENAGYHGYGMSAMIKYIATNFGNTAIKSIYNNIKKGQEPDYAIGNATNTDFAWYGLFLQQYTQGTIYNDVSTGMWVGNKTGEFQINSLSDTLKEFTASFHELAGKFYVVNISADAVSDESALEIKATQGYNAKVCAFKFSGSSIASEGYVLSQVNISNIKTIAQNGEKILILVSNLDNSYASDEDNNITFQIKVVKNKQLFTKISLDFDVMAHTLQTYETGNPSASQNRYYYHLTDVPAVQTGNVITASWNGVYTYQREGSATITLNGNTIVSYEITDQIDLGAAMEYITISGTNMPLNEEYPSGKYFKAESSCTSLTGYYSLQEFDTWSVETTDFYCEEQYGNDSYIELKYY